MSRVVASLSVSLDGFAAGPDQDEAHPIGVGGAALHEWIFATASGRRMVGRDGGTQGVDDGFFRRDADALGATVMGRNMFGPVRGPWSEPEWRGWWGESPPFHHPVFVLTHFARPPLVLGDTTFVFVTEGLSAALDAGRAVADGRDVAVAGGVATVRTALATRAVDALHLAVVAVDLGRGERLIDAVGVWPDGYVVSEVTPGEAATHYELVRGA